MLTEKDIMEARNSRYGRRRSQSIDYGSQGRGKSGFEQTPEQALYSHSCQILKTIPRFQYEAPSWVPNLLKVQDTQEERNAEDVFEYQYDTIPFEVNGKQYSEYRTFRVAVLGDVGAGKTSLLQIYLQKSESPTLLATNGVDYYEKLLVKDGICYRIIFCDFSGQVRLRPVLSAYLEAVNGAVFVIDGSNPQGLESLETFYIPELLERKKNDIPVQVILNKTDLECEVKRKSVQNLIRKTFPESQVVLAGKGMKSQGGNAAFRNVVRALMNEQRITNELCHLFLK